MTSKTAKEREPDSPRAEEELEALDQTLRPQRLNDYVGQEQIKENLRIFLSAARMRGEPLEHILLAGPAGLGKTTLAYIIAHELNVPLKVTSGPAIERVGDLAAILTNLEEGSILFIDEVHRLSRTVEEVMYPAMEDFVFDIVIGKGPSARTVQLQLPRFTLVGATTRAGLLSSPFRGRFGAHYRLDFYTIDDIAKILLRSARILKVHADEGALRVIAERSRQTPRTANRLLKRVRDYSQVKGKGTVTRALTEAALAMLEVDEKGLEEMDRKILETIVQKFSGGPVGLHALAASIGEEQNTIADVYEPYLLQAGFLARTPKGRVATALVYEHLKLSGSTPLL
jgi:Holliday junction DNA helicase RuvB